MRRYCALFATLALGACTTMDMVVLPPPAPSCASTGSLVESVVKIKNDRGIASAIMTASDEMITVKHVSTILGLSEYWHAVVISQLTGPHDTWHVATPRIRLKRVISASPEDIHVFEFARPLSWQPRNARLRTTPLALGEYVTGVGYPHGSRIITRGQRRTAEALLPLFGRRTPSFYFGTSKDGAWIDKGASGGGIFDCQGEVVALIAGGMPRLPYLHEQIFLLGSTNYYGVPTHKAATEVAR